MNSASAIRASRAAALGATGMAVLVTALLLYRWVWTFHRPVGERQFAEMAPTLPAVVEIAAASRNPFDAEGKNWTASRSGTPVVPGITAKDIRGVIVLPGLLAAITSKGLARVGEMIGSERLKSVDAKQLVVSGADGDRTIELSRALPTLGSLGKPAPVPTLQGLGK